MVHATGVERTTPSTLYSSTELRQELHRVRGDGFALSDHERHPYVRGIAVPIGGHTLAIGVAGRTDHLTPDRIGGTVRKLRRAASVLAREVRG